jgi:hypothetical protein
VCRGADSRASSFVASIARVVLTRCRAPFTCVARISRVDHACRAVSARDNKLFSHINTHVNDVNTSDYIF